MRWKARNHPEYKVKRAEMDATARVEAEHKEEQQQIRIKPLLEWHKWFAWHPVNIKGTYVWLEKVYRKGTVTDGYGGRYLEWEYNLEGQL